MIEVYRVAVRRRKHSRNKARHSEAKPKDPCILPVASLTQEDTQQRLWPTPP